MRRLEIHTIVMGSMQLPSFVVLRTIVSGDEQPTQLPIKIGPIEAASISAGLGGIPHNRPLTHDITNEIISELGGTLASVEIYEVQETSFSARLQLLREDGSRLYIDCRPSDAIALAVRSQVPILASDEVLSTATMPDFEKIEQQQQESQMEAFHQFVENLNPEDFINEE